MIEKIHVPDVGEYEGGKEWQPGIELFIDGDGSARLSATEWHSSDNGTLMSVWHGVDLQLRAQLSQGSLIVPDKQKLDAMAEQLLPLVQRVVAGHDTEWDGSNMVGTLNEDATKAFDELDRFFHEIRAEDYCSDDIEPWNIGDWLGNSSDGELGLSARMTDEDVEKLAHDLENEAKQNGILVVGHVLDVLRERRDELLSEAELEKDETVTP